MIHEIPRTCDVCGISVYFIEEDWQKKLCNFSDDANEFTCSLRCFYARKKELENKTSKRCQECKKVLGKKVCHAETGIEKFCSKKCAKKFLERKYGYCDECGKKIHHKPLKIMYYSELFCSKKCMKAYEQAITDTFLNDDFYKNSVK